jgi:hypothetical protein
MFTDMVDSTARTAELGQASAEVRRDLFALLRGALRDRAGTEVKNIGDGLMVTFASATDGVECAVLTQRRVARYNRRTRHPIAVRVGLSVGDAVTEGGDWFGRPAVEAARLCDRAEGGQVLASDAIRALSKPDAAHFSALGALELKGLTPPTHVYEVLWSETSGGELQLPLPTLIQSSRARGFAARDAEHAQLANVLAAAETDGRQVALISGEPGIGKTALASHFSAGAHERGVGILYGRCEEDAAMPYEPFVAVMHDLLAHLPDSFWADHLAEHGSELVRIVPGVQVHLGDATPPPAGADPAAQRYALFEAVTDALAVGARDGPLLVVLDDLHWAERSTLQLLRHLIRQLADARVVLVGTYRGVELDDRHPLAALLADLHREEDITRIELGGFDERDVLTLMETLAGHELDASSEQLARTIQRETGGNPFFIRELVRNLRETGELRSSGGRWSTDASVELPASVREVILRRVARLGEFAHQALASAAIIGREFDADLLRRALTSDEDQLADALDAAVRAGLVRKLSGRERHFEFAHALVEYTLYEDIGPARRMRGHHHVAVALEELCGERPESRATELAYHFGMSAAGADVRKAVAYATTAGDRALEQLASEEGVVWYERALRQLADVAGASEEERCELLIRLGQAQALAGSPKQRETLFEAAALARRLHDRTRLVRAALANERGRVYSKPGQVDGERVALLDDAIAAVGPEDSSERAELLARLGDELQFADDPQRRLALSDEALAIVRRLDAPEALIGVVAERALAIFSPDTVQTRRQEADEAVQAARRVNDSLLRYHALRCRIVAAISAGDIAAARDDLAEARALTRRTAHPIAHWFTAILCCTMSTLLGRLDEAEGFAEEGFDFASRSGQPDAAFVRESQLAPIRLEQGRMEELRAVFEVFARELPGVPACRGVLTLAQSETGMQREACENLHAAAREGFAPMDIAWGAAVGSYALAASRISHSVAAGALYPLLAPYEQQIAYTTVNAWMTIAHHLGALARVSGRLELAERHLWVAAQLGERMGTPIWLARTQLEQARVRILRGAATADVEPVLESARDAASRLGAAGLEADVTAALENPEPVTS